MSSDPGFGAPRVNGSWLSAADVAAITAGSVAEDAAGEFLVRNLSRYAVPAEPSSFRALAEAGFLALAEAVGARHAVNYALQFGWAPYRLTVTSRRTVRAFAVVRRIYADPGLPAPAMTIAQATLAWALNGRRVLEHLQPLPDARRVDHVFALWAEFARLGVYGDVVGVCDVSLRG